MYCHWLLLGCLQWSVNPCAQVTPLLAEVNPYLNTWAPTLEVCVWTLYGIHLKAGFMSPFLQGWPGCWPEYPWHLYGKSWITPNFQISFTCLVGCSQHSVLNTTSFIRGVPYFPASWEGRLAVNNMDTKLQVSGSIGTTSHF